MIAAVRLQHRGRLCVIPAGQAESAAAVDPDTEPLRLWEADVGEEAGARDGRSLRVTTAAGARSLRCSEVRVFELQDGAVRPLPPLLSDLIGMPYVIGMVELDDGVGWFVDLGECGR